MLQSSNLLLLFPTLKDPVTISLVELQ